MKRQPTSAPASDGTSVTLRELVVCSLEAWDEVWRRNQFLVDQLLRRQPALRVLFVEPPVDVLFELSRRRWPARPGMKALSEDGRMQTLRPLKPLPRRLGSFSDAWVLRQVIAAARRLEFRQPVLWLNDVTFAPLIAQTGWPAIYDVTDDWLLVPSPPRELARLRALDALALSGAAEVVVCSPALAESRGGARPVTLVPNGVDREHFRRPRPRPDDLPPAPTAVYSGTLHESRLDVELLISLARSMPKLHVVLVGPDSLSRGTRERLISEPNIRLLGARRYAEVPGYLQHADVVIVPHRITPFTDSLDPIKAYECLAIDTPVVATPVAGFRALEPYVTVAPASAFAGAVNAVLSSAARAPSGAPTPSWAERAAAFEAVLGRAATRAGGAA